MGNEDATQNIEQIVLKVKELVETDNATEAIKIIKDALVIQVLDVN